MGNSIAPIIAPSLLASDFGHLNATIDIINASEADWFHVDVMDGHFVPNISFGFPVLEALVARSHKEVDVHLMITEPDRYIRRFREAGADRITVHQEACLHLDRTLRFIRELGMAVGVAINPATPVLMLENVLHLVDQICLMSVNPGYGGQIFLEHTYQKLNQLTHLMAGMKKPPLIMIDGGVDLSNASTLIRQGADILVAGSFIFEAEDPQAIIHSLKASNNRPSSLLA